MHREVVMGGPKVVTVKVKITKSVWLAFVYPYHRPRPFCPLWLTSVLKKALKMAL